MFKKRDLVLDFLLISTVIVGLFSLLSISNYYFIYQGYFVVVAIILYFVVPLVSFKNYSLVFPFATFVVLGSLLYLFLFGQAARGSASWIDLGPVNFQPSEIAKVVVIFYTSLILTKSITLFKKIVYVGLISGPILVLVLLQPDFGTFAITFFVIASYFFLNINSLKLILLSAFTLVILGVVSFGFLQDYQKARLTSFFDPSKDALGSGYNVIQSKIAIGSGGLFGKGFKQNTQVTLNFLPEPQTDFIFASSSESYGFFYSLLMLILIYGLCMWVYTKYFLKIEDMQKKYFAYGVFILLFTQATLNIGMNLGLLPVTGLPLPLISYGGSSLLTFFILFGFLQLINNEERSV